jgi:hypothetical protein
MYNTSIHVPVNTNVCYLHIANTYVTGYQESFSIGSATTKFTREAIRYKDRAIKTLNIRKKRVMFCFSFFREQ